MLVWVYLHQFFQAFLDGVVGDIFHLAFIVNGEQVNSGVGYLHVGDDAYAAEFPFPFDEILSRIL